MTNVLVICYLTGLMGIERLLALCAKIRTLYYLSNAMLKKSLRNQLIVATIQV